MQKQPYYFDEKGIKVPIENKPRTVTVPYWTCLRCANEWQGRGQTSPKQCPKCKNSRWNLPYKYAKRK